MKRGNASLDSLRLIGGGFTAHERQLRKALRDLIAASEDLSRVIKATTYCLDREAAVLMDATNAAKRLLNGGAA